MIRLLICRFLISNGLLSNLLPAGYELFPRELAVFFVERVVNIEVLFIKSCDKD
ncbi:Uncharacterised protein [Mycobacteroides abscessus subsp. abscessus]|nr:Uncharacterised protein [Mycobacteroides abscessus subsp. abscessus]